MRLVLHFSPEGQRGIRKWQIWPVSLCPIGTVLLFLCAEGIGPRCTAAVPEFGSSCGFRSLCCALREGGLWLVHASVPSPGRFASPSCVGCGFGGTLKGEFVPPSPDFPWPSSELLARCRSCGRASHSSLLVFLVGSVAGTRNVHGSSERELPGQVVERRPEDQRAERWNPPLLR